MLPHLSNTLNNRSCYAIHKPRIIAKELSIIPTDIYCSESIVLALLITSRMGEWNITMVNKTGDGGHPHKNVDFMLFQIPPDKLAIDSWTNAWKVAEVGYPGNVGPIVLPTKVQFYVIDRTYSNPRTTGPFDAKFGQTLSVAQKKADDAPIVSITSEKAAEGEIKVVNEVGNAKPLEMALYKNGRKLLSFKDVRPADAVYLAVEPAIYIADVDGSVKEGVDFKAVVQAAKATQFQLFPDKTKVTILIKQLGSGELQFVEDAN